MSVLVTGGAGYIGSHAVQRLVRDGHTVVVVDNLVRGHQEAVDAIRQSSAEGRVTFVPGDIGDRVLLQSVMREHAVKAVMHFAALAYVGESVTEPLRYYRANTAAALALIEACADVGVERFVFSSTCASYGEPDATNIPIPETCPQRPINPYGRSKLFVEHMLDDYAEACRREGRPFAYAMLRYFNVAGSDRSGLLGEDHEPETHLIPVVIQSVLGRREAVTIFGTDYPTPDGTCVRDYVHVEDLIDAHVQVLEAMKPVDRRVYNLGIGRGYSVREVIDSVRRVTGRQPAVREGPRRAGDPPVLFADPAKIRSELGWSASLVSLDEIVATAWRWMREHPKGYAS
ncbi:MAG: UDP-glucose 4-epimerase GalE [Phycisphaerae bacterium]|nr:UDP-glucose 4-epimerase GalE [Phycisphaerae bacterium]